MQAIVPCLWFDDAAEEAANFYVSIFPNSRIVKFARYGKEGAKVSGCPEGSVMTVDFELNGQRFTALNGGPIFKISPAISFVVDCETQEEIDMYWSKLSDGGKEVQCGWLEDKYGVSWQIVPIELAEMVSDPDPEKAERVMQAMLKMVKIDLSALRKAYRGL